jgi:hypothetical protein
MDATQATDQFLKNLSGVGEALKTSSSTIGQIGTSVTFGAGGAGAEFVTLVNGMRDVTSKMPKDVEEFRRIVEQMAMDPGTLTKNMAAMQEAVQRSKAAAETIANIALPKFSGALVTTAETMDAVTVKLKNLLEGIPSPSKIEAQPQSVRQSWQAATTKQAAAGTVPGVAEYSAWEPGEVPVSSGTASKTRKSKVAPTPEESTATQKSEVPPTPGSNITPKKAEENQTEPISSNSIPKKLEGLPKKALGGITSGISIAGESGPEAVVPLPNGRTIPVEIKSTETVYGQIERNVSQKTTEPSRDLEGFFQNQLRTMQASAATLENILTVLRDSYDTQDRLLANSY